MSDQPDLRVEWDSGVIGFRDGQWIALRDDDGSAEAAAAVANLGETLNPHSPSRGMPGAIVAHQIARWMEGRAIIPPSSDSPGTVY